MESIRKWFYKPKKGDRSLLAQFFFADEALNLVAAELDSFDGRKDPERCTALVNHLRQCQDKVLTICNRIMDDVIPYERADRDFRVKFPDDVMQENLAGQLWFGAECLAAGSSIMNREAESAGMRPLAKAVTKALENVRNLLREQCLRGNVPPDSERLAESLKILDRLFAEFELCYVSAMVPVKSSREYELHQLVVVLFSETLHRALEMRLLTQDMVDTYDPALMFTIPRLAIVSGLLVFPDSPLCLDRTPADMSEMFRPFRTLLLKIRELLWTLSKRELYTLEKLLCSSEEINDYSATSKNEPDSAVKGVENSYPAPDLDEFVSRFYTDYPNCKQFVSDFYSTADEGALASWENSDSEDETEWAGEASECDTIVTARSLEENDNEEPLPVLNRRKSSLTLNLENAERNVTSEAPCCSSRDLLSPETEDPCSATANRVEKLEPKELAQLIEELMNDDGSYLPPESPTEPDASIEPKSDLTPSTSSPSSTSDTIEIRTGFLLANKIGQTSLEDDPPTPPLCAESLPDGDSKEAMSVATATLSTLLLSNSPGLSPGSPLDSGLGTVVSCSDGGSFSDRSPDAALSLTNGEEILSLPAGARDQSQESGANESSCTCSTTHLPVVDEENQSLPQPIFPVCSEHDSNSTDIPCACGLCRSLSNDTILYGDHYMDPLTDIPQNARNVLNLDDTSVLNSADTIVSASDDFTIPLNGPTVTHYFHKPTRHGDLERSKRAKVIPPPLPIRDMLRDETKARSKGRYYKKGLRGGASSGNEQSYAGNWDSLVKQHSKLGAQVGSRRRPREVGNLPTVESESSYSSTCSSCRHSMSDSCSVSSDTSSFNSECQDDEEIALAMQAAEIANRNEARSKFRSSEDLVHRLFVCVAGVADQLQTNFAGDLRHILKCVFQINNSAEEEDEEEEEQQMEEAQNDEGPTTTTTNDLCRNVDSAEEALGWDTAPSESPEVETPPPWVPDDLAPRCMSCESVFTVVRRRHHCRNCGKVFCARCSSNTVALPRYGHSKPVRVCNRCFLYQVTPFTIDQIAAHS